MIVPAGSRDMRGRRIVVQRAQWMDVEPGDQRNITRICLNISRVVSFCTPSNSVLLFLNTELFRSARIRVNSS